MRHDLCHRCRRRRRRCAMQFALAITPRAPGMGKAPRTPALVAPPRLAQRGSPRLCAAFTAAVASTSVAHAAYQHFGLAACADEHSRAHGPGLGPAARSGSRHRRSGSRPESALRSAPNRRRRRWTSAPAGAILCTHSWLTRWGAAAGITGLSLRLPRPFYNTANLLPRLGLRHQRHAPTGPALRIGQCIEPAHCPARLASIGGLGGTPRSSLRHSRQASGSDAAHATHASRVLQRRRSPSCRPRVMTACNSCPQTPPPPEPWLTSTQPSPGQFC
jgi:hypothetical protein